MSSVKAPRLALSRNNTRRPTQASRRIRIAPPAPLDQLLASVSWSGHSCPAHCARHEIYRRSNEAALWNANYVGTHFGGVAVGHDRYILYADADGEPGPRIYRVGQGCDPSGTESRGRERRAEFGLSDSQIEDIHEKLTSLPKYEAIFSAEVKDESGAVIAEVEKVLHVRKKETAQLSEK
jgi:hypothetical protein